MHAIEIRPRFTLVSSLKKFEILRDLEKEAATDPKVFCKIMNDHAYMKIVQKDYHFWSPELHLSVEETSDGSLIKGVVGPAPTVWTMFMFFYFAAIGAVLFACIHTYSDWVINQEEAAIWPIPASLGLLLAVFVGSKAAARFANPQTETLKAPLRKVLAQGDLHEVTD